VPAQAPGASTVPAIALSGLYGLKTHGIG